MAAAAEGEVRVRIAADVEGVGAFEGRLVAVGREEHREHDLAGGDPHAAEVEVETSVQSSDGT